MILFGRKAHHLGLQEVKKVVCVKCNKQNMVISVFQSFFHLLWLPMFPIKKKCASQCIECQNVQIEKKFNSQQREIAHDLKKEHATPYWTFAGTFLFVIGLILKELYF